LSGGPAATVRARGGGWGSGSSSVSRRSGGTSSSHPLQTEGDGGMSSRHPLQTEGDGGMSSRHPLQTEGGSECAAGKAEHPHRCPCLLDLRRSGSSSACHRPRPPVSTRGGDESGERKGRWGALGPWRDARATSVTVRGWQHAVITRSRRPSGERPTARSGVGCGGHA
jgi:hypothetical protein